MATLKSKRKQEAEIEKYDKEVEQSAPVEETSESQYLNGAEQTALAEQHERDVDDSRNISIDKMKDAIEVVSEQFNLYGKDFVVTGFVDKGSKCQLSMSNGDFDISIVIKDTEKLGIM